MINQTKIPPLEFMRTKDNCIKFKIGKLRFKSNEDFQYIYNVEIEISEKIVINFRDPKNLIDFPSMIFFFFFLILMIMNLNIKGLDSYLKIYIL